MMVECRSFPGNLLGNSACFNSRNQELHCGKCSPPTKSPYSGVRTFWSFWTLGGAVQRLNWVLAATRKRIAFTHTPPKNPDCWVLISSECCCCFQEDYRTGWRGSSTVGIEPTTRYDRVRPKALRLRESNIHHTAQQAQEKIKNLKQGCENIMADCHQLQTVTTTDFFSLVLSGTL